MARKIEEYSPNQYSKAAYSLGYFGFKLDGDFKPHLQMAMPNTVADVGSCWDARKFREPRRPYVVGSVQDRDTFDMPGAIRCLHLPVKFPGTDVRIPFEYQQFREALGKALHFEQAINADFHDYYAYLTVDQRFVPKGMSQRLPGAHVDGIPRDVTRASEQAIDHAYIITNNLPSRFYTHPFPIDLYDLEQHNLFSVMRYFADESNSVLSKPYDINLMNAYSVHTAISSQRHCFRTFVRLEFSVLKFDRIGNAVNPHFKYDWDYRECSIPAHLIIPDDLKLE
jgi:hypothetical protein